MSETRGRFLREIADRVPPDRIAEVYLFPAIRQGGQESGVAVVAAEPALAVEATGERAESCDPTEDAARTDRPETAEVRPTVRRHTVLTARYRLTLKGPERGTWEFDLVAEADAPLVTVEAVVRGVQQRAGELAEPERLSGAALATPSDESSCPATM